MERTKERDRSVRSFVWPASVLLVYVYHLLRYLHNDIWGSIYTVYYPFLVPVLIAFTLFSRRGEWKKEEKVFLLFWVWVFISRLLNGDFYLTKDADMVLNTGMSYVFLVSCLMLKGEHRQRFLDCISLVTIGFYTLLALACLYAVLFRKELYNPFTGSLLCGFYSGTFRLTAFGKNPNECTVWFFMAFYLIVYQLFRQKSWWLKVPLLLSAALNYIILGMTFSRNGMLAFSICFALLLVLLTFEKLPLRRTNAKLLATVALLVVVVPAAYLSFKVNAAAMNRISAALVYADEQADEAASGQSETDTSAVGDRIEDSMYIDTRGFEDAGRFAIFKSIIPTMRQDPLRLMRGCLCQDVMKISNTVLPKIKPHFHNTFLQLFCLTGLPGLTLILAFCWLLAVRIIRLFFSEAPLAVKSLTLILIGSFIYNMLEVSLFVAADTRAFVAYIIAGAVMAYSYEMEEPTGQA